MIEKNSIQKVSFYINNIMNFSFYIIFYPINNKCVINVI